MDRFPVESIILVERNSSYFVAEGEELSLEVRILGAVDVVEAMSTRRPYREARTREKALNVIKDREGDKFDPGVVEVLVEMIEEGK